ncbi:MAG: hypothetical protein RLZZ540_3050 [Bacteroidota bacterium]|jgi:hypothetical protein
MSAYKHKEMQIYRYFISLTLFGVYWRFLAITHIAMILYSIIYFVKNIKSYKSMERSNQYLSSNWNGFKPFFPAIFNPVPPTGGRIICSPEQSKLCFEALEMNSVPQNNLPLQGLKTPSEVGVF